MRPHDFIKAGGFDSNSAAYMPPTHRLHERLSKDNSGEEDEKKEAFIRGFQNAVKTAGPTDRAKEQVKDTVKKVLPKWLKETIDKAEEYTDIELPKGYEADVGSSGLEVSGGLAGGNLNTKIDPEDERASFNWSFKF